MGHERTGRCRPERRWEHTARTAIGAAVVIAICCTAGCSGSSSPVTEPSHAASTASSSGDLAPGTTDLDCTSPIGSEASPPRRMLDVVGLDIDSTWTVDAICYTAESTVTIPGDWASKVSIAWGNHAAVWTTSLDIPACPQPWSGAQQWLVYPGGFSLDAAACVPLEVRAGATTTTFRIPVGVPCPAWRCGF